MYTRLPLADEIREARAAHQEATEARQLLQQVSTTLEAVDAVARQHDRVDHSATPVPGDALITAVTERWAVLADLPSAGPRATTPYTQQLQARRTQLTLTEQVLRPISREMTERLEALHSLQQQQRLALQEPGYGPVLQQIQALSTEREAAIEVFQPLKQRLGIVDPTLTLLDTFITQLDGAEKTGRTQPDPAGAVAWRTSYLAGNFLESVAEVLESVAFGITVPDKAPIPDLPSPDAAAQRWVEVNAAQAQMRALRSSITAQASDMQERARAAYADYEELSAKIQVLTG